MIKFPVIKYFSKYFTPTFLKYSISANQITFLSLITGILACVCFVFIDHLWHLGGAFLLLINYILDNCDGEVARAQNQTSKFGAQFDTFVDWIIHTLFFSAIGIQTSKLFVNEIWFWMGLFGSIGKRSGTERCKSTCATRFWSTNFLKWANCNSVPPLGV